MVSSMAAFRGLPDPGSSPKWIRSSDKSLKMRKSTPHNVSMTTPLVSRVNLLSKRSRQVFLCHSRGLSIGLLILETGFLVLVLVSR